MAAPCVKSRKIFARASLGALWVLCALLSGCSAPGTRRVPPDPEVLLTEPAVETSEVTVVERLVRFHGETLDAAARAALELARREGRAVSAQEIQDALEASGHTVFAFVGAADRSAIGLLHHLDRRRPLLLLISEGSSTSAWVLLVGYDEARRLFIHQRTDGRLAAFTFDDLHRLWEKAERMTILAIPATLSEPVQ